MASLYERLMILLRAERNKRSGEEEASLAAFLSRGVGAPYRAYAFAG